MAHRILWLAKTTTRTLRARRDHKVATLEIMSICILESITTKEFKNLLEILALAPLPKSIEEVEDFIAVSFLRANVRKYRESQISSINSNFG